MCAFLIILPILIIDQLTKFIIVRNFQPGDSVPVIKNVFHISFVCNKGAAFGILSKQSSVFIWIYILAILFVSLLLIYYKNIFQERRSTQVFLSLVCAGAIGNLIDRIRFGCVIDFLDFRIWPVFNIADSAITIGTFLLVLQMLKTKHKKQPRY